VGFLELFFSLQYAVFELPGLAAAIYLALLTTGAVMAEHDADADLDVDQDLDLDADVDADFDVGADFDADVDVDVDADLDLDADFDVDMDADVDLDLDTDVDLDTDLDVEAGVDLDADVDADVGIDQDLDLDSGAGVEHAVGMDHGAPQGAGTHEPGAFLRVLAFLGIGRVPISIILMTFCFLWAALGISANLLFDGLLPGVTVLLASLPAAALGSVFGTRALAIGISKVLPSVETYAITGIELVGSVGEALFDITEEFGRVRVFDQYNTLHDVTALVKPGRPAIEKGSNVLLTRYDREQDLYYARPHTGRLGGPEDMELLT
jgi:hypothetical protein